MLSDEDFGSTLPAVEANFKKHEAIVADVNTYERRVQALNEPHDELERENYHDFQRITEKYD